MYETDRIITGGVRGGVPLVEGGIMFGSVVCGSGIPLLTLFSISHSANANSSREREPRLFASDKFHTFYSKENLRLQLKTSQ